MSQLFIDPLTKKTFEALLVDTNNVPGWLAPLWVKSKPEEWEVPIDDAGVCFVCKAPLIEIPHGWKCPNGHGYIADGETPDMN